MTKTCEVAECGKDTRARGWCDTHYRRWKKYGSTTLPEREPKPWRGCSVEDCDREFYATGYCYLHWSRVRRNGTTDIIGPVSGEDHHWWQGDSVGYGALHARISRERGRASEHSCSECSEPAAEWAYDYSDPSPAYAKRRGLYSVDPHRYRPMCVPCHKVFDAQHAARRKGAA